jgi:serine/threonine-protein kinase
VSDISRSALERINDACDRFAEAWQGGRRPRVAEFLLDAPEDERPALRCELLGEAVFYLKADQRHRWEQGERVAVADYLREEPELREGAEQVLELVANEVVLRRERGEAPCAEDYLALLPGHEAEAELRRLCAGPQDVIPPTVDSPRVRDTMRPGPAAETLPADGPPGEPLPPDLGRYLPRGFLGRGGMGDVFWVHDAHLGRDLALKVLRPEYRGRPQLVRRFLMEARAHSRLQHPGFAPVHDQATAGDGRPYFTMKLVRGRTLADRLQERTDPARELPRFVAVFEQVCQAMAYAHAQGVIHRDLKPANVMVGEFGEVQVMDLGLAKVLGPAAEGEAAPAGQEKVAPAPGAAVSVDGGTQPGHVMGTPAYMPPEQARGEVEQVDRRSDVFGLGAILCEVLTGRPPFAGKGPEEVWARAQACDHAEALARLDGCGADAGLVRLCKGCLAAGPAGRPGDAGEVARAVAAYQAGVQERLRRAELEKAAAEARAAGERKRRRLAVVLTAAVVALALGGSVWGWQYAKNTRSAEADLNEAARLLDAEMLPAYAEALERAEGRLGGGGPAELRRRAEELRDLLGVVRRLEQARLAQASGVREGIFDWARADEAYAKEFARYGLEGDDPDVEEVARRISASPIKGLLMAALDDWFSSSLRPGRQKLLLAVAARVDTDPWRNRLRNAVARGDKAEVLQLAKEAEPERLPPSTLLMLGGALGRVGAEEAVRVLEVGQPYHPGDFWVNHNLAWWLLKQKPSRPGEAAGYLRAALATRPDSPGAHVNLGFALEDQGRRKEAEVEYREALRLKPDYPEAHNNLGSALWGQGRWKEAEAEFREALRLKPDYSEAHNNLGLALSRQGKPKEAEAEYREALRLKPDGPMAHYNLGLALWDQGKPKEAEAELREALRLKPDLPDAHNGLGEALWGQGRLTEAEAEYREAIRLKPDYPEAHNNLGNALLRQGKPKEAEAGFREALRLKPDYPEAHNGLGNALWGQGRLTEAEAEYREAIRLKPDYPEAHNNLGNALSRQGKLKEAEAEYREALRLKPDGPMAHYNLGNTLWDQGKPKEAEAELGEALRLKPDLPEAHNGLGKALWDQGKPKEAEAKFREALRLKPDYPEAHNGLGLALWGQGRLTEAEAEHHEALRLKPDYPEAHNGLGNALSRQGKPKEAEAEFREALRLKPDYPEAHNNLGLALSRQGKPKEAEAELREALRLKPDLLMAHYNLGDALRSQGNLQGAEAEYREALRLKPDLPEAHYSLGLVLRTQGKLREAVAEYREALRLKPDLPEAHCNLGHLLRRQGYFEEALASLRRGHELGSKQPGWRYPSAEWVRQAERLAALDRKLAAILKGQGQPADAAERLALARFCQQHKNLPRAAARFYADAFAAEPKLAAEPPSGHRYNAACNAALAAAGQGEDAMNLADEERTRLRQQALDWLRADLTAWTKVLDKGPPQARQVVAQTLQHWQKDTDLAGLRDKAALDKLPAAERDAWQRLWADVDALLKRAQQK